MGKNQYFDEAKKWSWQAQYDRQQGNTEAAERKEGFAQRAMVEGYEQEQKETREAIREANKAPQVVYVKEEIDYDKLAKAQIRAQKQQESKEAAYEILVAINGGTKGIEHISPENITKELMREICLNKHNVPLDYMFDQFDKGITDFDVIREKYVEKVELEERTKAAREESERKYNEKMYGVAETHVERLLREGLEQIKQDKLELEQEKKLTKTDIRNLILFGSMIFIPFGIFIVKTIAIVAGWF